jgi:hypothetical protein
MFRTFLPWRFALTVSTAGLLAVTLSGCVLPVSEHPLSDEKTSVIDERLIGYWDIKLGESDSADPMRFVVGRHPKSPNVLEFAFTSIEGDQHIQIHRGRLFTAKVGEQWMLSFDGADEKQPHKHEYTIMRYDFQPRAGESHDVVELRLLVDSVVAPAIEKGELTGQVTRDKPGGKFTSIRITAEPEELMEFFRKNQSKCFTPDAVKAIRVNRQ